MAYQYLTFFLDDEAKLEEIRREYGAGRMKTYDVKQVLVEVLQKIVREHQVSSRQACSTRWTRRTSAEENLSKLGMPLCFSHVLTPQLVEQEARAKVTEEEVDYFMSQSKFKTKTTSI